MAAFAKKNWFGLLSVFLSASILLYFMAYSGGLSQLGEMLKGVQKSWLLYACLAVAASWTLDAVTLHLVIRRVQGCRQRIMSTIKYTIVGMLYCALTPFAVGGQPMQIAQMVGSGIESGHAVSIISVKSMVYQIGITVYAIVAIVACFSFFLAGVANFLLFSILGLLANLLFIGAILFMGTNTLLTQRIANYSIAKLGKLHILKHPERTLAASQAQIKVFHDSFATMKNSIPTLLFVLLLTFVQLTFLYLVPYFICRGFAASHTNLLYMISSNAIITMITAFIPLPGGSGAAEGSFHLFFSLFLIKSAIFPALFLWRVLTYYSIIVLGGIMSAANIIVKPVDTKQPKITP